MLQRERKRGLVPGIRGIPDEDSPDTREARELGGTESSGARSLGKTVLVDAISDGIVCLSAQQLDISGGSGILEQLRRAGRGVVLFCGVGRPTEAKILPGMAGNQHGGGQRWEWGGSMLCRS